MPNYCSNTILIESEDIESLKAFLKDMEGDEEIVEDGSSSGFKLQKLHPMPQALSIDEDSKTKNAYVELYVNKTPIDELPSHVSAKDIENAKIYHENNEAYGCFTWYDWCSTNWGTKWDVEADISSVSASHISYRFESAWSPPINAVLEGSKKYPNLTWKINYYEDGNDFVGFDIIKNGQTLESMEDSLSTRRQAQSTIVGCALDSEKSLVINISSLVFTDIYDLKNKDKDCLNIKIKIKDLDYIKDLIYKEKLYEFFYDEVNTEILEIFLIDNGLETVEVLDSDINDIVSNFLQNDFDFDGTVKTLKENNDLKENIKESIDRVSDKLKI